MKARHACAVLCALVCAGLVFSPQRAHAHQVGLSRGEYLLTGDRLDIEIGFAHRDLAAALPALDRDGDGVLTAGELAAGTAIVDRDLLAPLRVTSGRRTCPVERLAADIDGEDALIKAHATCPSGAADLELVFGFLTPFPAGHRHLAHVRAGAADQETIALAASPRVRIEISKPIAGRYDRSAFSFGLVLALLGLAWLGLRRRKRRVARRRELTSGRRGA
jgi:hypothetical protein